MRPVPHMNHVGEISREGVFFCEPLSHRGVALTLTAKAIDFLENEGDEPEWDIPAGPLTHVQTPEESAWAAALLFENGVTKALVDPGNPDVVYTPDAPEATEEITGYEGGGTGVDEWDDDDDYEDPDDYDPYWDDDLDDDGSGDDDDSFDDDGYEGSDDDFTGPGSYDDEGE